MYLMSNEYFRSKNVSREKLKKREPTLKVQYNKEIYSRLSSIQFKKNSCYKINEERHLI